MEVFIILSLAILGLISHFLKKMIELKKLGIKITVKQYYFEHPLESISSIVLCFAGILMLWGSDELTRITAFTFGFMSDSVVAMVLKRKVK